MLFIVLFLLVILVLAVLFLFRSKQMIQKFKVAGSVGTVLSLALIFATLYLIRWMLSFE